MAEQPTFPPLLTGKPVTAPRRPFAVACGDVRGGKAGAGDVYYAQNTRIMDCAVVLEPEIPLRQSLQMPYVMQVGFGDAFGVLAEPETALYFHWPDRILVNSAEAGRLRLAAPGGVGLDDVPPWMVLNIVVEIEGEEGAEPGLNPERTNLREEGCIDITCAGLIESFCRHFLAWVHIWEEDGFRPVHDAWIGRAVGYEQPLEFKIDGQPPVTGKVIGLDEAGALLVKPEQGAVTALELDRIIERQGGGSA